MLIIETIVLQTLFSYIKHITLIMRNVCVSASANKEFIWYMSLIQHTTVLLIRKIGNARDALCFKSTKIKLTKASRVLNCYLKFFVILQISVFSSQNYYSVELFFSNMNLLSHSRKHFSRFLFCLHPIVCNLKKIQHLD